MGTRERWNPQQGPDTFQLPTRARPTGRNSPNIRCAVARFFILIEPLVSAVFALHHNRGAYAVLLGSGISRAAGILTGYEIVGDLARRVAVASGAEPPEDGLAWFKAKYDSTPDYSTLLELLADTPAGRRNLLASYFEPSESEREQGRKVPTLAHRAVASLVASGHVKVVITTNFDQLLEIALRDSGVAPQIIASPDAAKGALPFAHAKCTVLKVNGDYLDTRIRNTRAELTSYEPEVDALLDRVFDEYGLIVSGWSTDWDHGLRSAIERAPNRRFTTFWTVRSNPTASAQALIDLRKAVAIRVDSADAFFSALAERSHALAELDRSTPLSIEALVATEKRYLADPQHRIRLSELVRDETEAAVERGRSAGSLHGHPDASEIRRRADFYVASCDRIMPMMVVGTRWGDGDQQDLWTAALRRLASLSAPLEAGNTALLDLRSFPCLITMYAAAVASIAGEQFGTLGKLMTVPVLDDDKETPLATSRIVRNRAYAAGLSKPEHYTPLSECLHPLVRECLRGTLPDDHDFDDAFDFLEALIAMLNVIAHPGKWVPYGRFAWRWANRPERRVRLALRFSPPSHPWARVIPTLFAGDTGQFEKAFGVISEEAVNSGRWM